MDTGVKSCENTSEVSLECPPSCIFRDIIPGSVNDASIVMVSRVANRPGVRRRDK